MKGHPNKLYGHYSRVSNKLVMWLVRNIVSFNNFVVSRIVSYVFCITVDCLSECKGQVLS